jgi:hypothetical protein
MIRREDQTRATGLSCKPGRFKRRGVPIRCQRQRRRVYVLFLPMNPCFSRGPDQGSDDADKARRLKPRNLARNDVPDGQIPNPRAGAPTTA